MSFPIAIPDLTDIEPTVDAFLARLKPLNLAWRVERNNQFGKARALAVFELNPQTQEIWAIAALEQATAGKHRHNPGGIYGELVISLAGVLNELQDDGTPVKLGPARVIFHAPNTIHQASADVFWAGIYHQPFGCTPIATTQPPP
jgi:hypothetical protein